MDLTIIAVGILAVFTYMFGIFDILIQGTFMFIVLNFSIRVVKVWHNREVNSTKSENGIFKKIMFLSMILIGHWLDNVSLILENISETGLLILKFLEKVFDKLDNDKDEESD